MCMHKYIIQTLIIVQTIIQIYFKIINTAMHAINNKKNHFYQTSYIYVYMIRNCLIRKK